MNPRVTSIAAAAMLFAAPAFAFQVTVTNSQMTAGDDAPTVDIQSANLTNGVEFEAIGSYFIDFEDDGEAFIMIVLDDVDPTLSPLAMGSIDEYHIEFNQDVDGSFAIATEGSTAGLAEHAEVEVIGGEIIVTFHAGAEVYAGNRLVVAFNEVTSEYAEGDIASETVIEDD